MADELTRLQNSYNQLKAMGFDHGEILSFLNGTSKTGDITKKEAVDAMVLYFRAKHLLADSHVRQIIKGNEHLKGSATLPKDVATLFAYESFVDALDRAEVLKGVGSGKKEVVRTWENYFAELEQAYEKGLKNKGNGTRRQVETLAEVKKNPFDYRLKDYLNQYMSEQIKSDVAFAINMDQMALAVVKGIPFAAGRNKQESYADVVLKYLYADTAVSKETAKLAKSEELVGKLRAQLQAKGSVESQLSASETAIIAAIAGVSSDIRNVFANAPAEIKVAVENGMATLNQTIVSESQMTRSTVEREGQTSRKQSNQHAGQIRADVRAAEQHVVESVYDASGAVISYLGMLNDDLKAAIAAGNPTQAEQIRQLIADTEARHAEVLKAVNYQGYTTRAYGINQARGMTNRIKKVDQGVSRANAGIDSANTKLDTLLNKDKKDENKVVKYLVIGGLVISLAVAAGSLSYAISEHNDLKEANAKIVELEQNQESHTASDIKPDNYDQTIKDAENLAKFYAFMNSYNEKATDGLTTDELSDLQQVINAETDAQLKDSLQDILNMALAMGGQPIVSDDSEYAKNEAKEYAEFKSYLDELKADGKITEQEYTSALEKITAYSANDRTEYSSTAPMTDVLNAEYNLSVAQVQAEALNKEVVTLKNEIESLKGSGTTDAATIASLREQIAEKDEKIAELEQKLATGTGSEDVVKELQEQLATTKAELADAKAQVESLSKENSSLTSENTSLKEQLALIETEYKAAVESLKADIKTLTETNTNNASKIAGYMSEIEALKALNDQLQDQLKNVASQEDYAAAQQTIKSLQSSLESVEAQLAAAIQNSSANSAFIDSLYESLTLQSSGSMTDEEIRSAIAYYLGLNYSENTNGSEADYPSYN